MKLKGIAAVVVAVALGGLVSSTLIAKDNQKDLEAKAKISRADAEKTALAKFPGGTIKEGEIEDEDGKLIWSFDIKTAASDKLEEVEIDAATGAILTKADGKEEDQDKEQGKEEDDDKGGKEDDK